MFLPVLLLTFVFNGMQEPASNQSQEPQTAPAPVRTQFHVKYVSGSDVYIDGGRNAGLAEGTKLIVKQDPTKPASGTNVALEPGIIARLKVISAASTSAVCEVEAAARDLVENDVVWLPEQEVAKLVERDTLGNTRKYPMVVSFTEGDPLDEEIREAQPRPALPEVNQIRGRLGFNLDTIQEIVQGGATSNEIGMIFRADFTRMFGTHWNLVGYWRGSFQKSSSSSQQTLQNLINRTYLMSLSYINPDSRLTAGIGRLFIPWASSLQTIDGGYVGLRIAPHALLGAFGGSTPDPSAWDYNPKRKIAGGLFNAHGGAYDNFHYSSTAGGGVNMLGWTVDRPFLFTENEFSYKRYFSLYHSMQIDKPSANPGTTQVGIGLGQSLLTVRAEVHPRVTLELTDTYFRDVPTYDPTLVGTGLLDKYLYQGINGGARIKLPLHMTGYFSIGQSSDSGDSKSSGNRLYGLTMARIWKTGIQVDARYSEFSSAFATGTYRSAMLTRDLGERFRLNIQGGQYKYASTLASNNNSNFVNATFDTNLGARLFYETMFTTQRGGSLNYNQWVNTLGFRFDNRAAHKKLQHPNSSPTTPSP